MPGGFKQVVPLATSKSLQFSFLSCIGRHSATTYAAVYRKIHMNLYCFTQFAPPRHLLAVLAGLVLLLAAESALAQNRYQPPAGHTLPSQLNYFRRDVGLLDQYNTFVQPQRQLEQRLRQMTQQQLDDYRSAQRQIEQIKQIRPTDAAPTGTGAGFLNYSHYYRLPSVGNRGSGR